MKISSNISFLVVLMLFASCGSMDDNYVHYLEEATVYSPKVTNVQVQSLLKEVILTWDNPSGDIAKQIIVDYQDSVITTETMIDSLHLTNLEIKGYTINIYTKDAFGNLSIPATVTAFPNGEEE